MTESIWNFDAIHCVADYTEPYNYISSTVHTSVMKYYKDEKIYKNGYIPLISSDVTQIYFITDDGINLDFKMMTKSSIIKIIGIKF